jgi:membrane fusion protein (multidrug efflux system)
MATEPHPKEPPEKPAASAGENAGERDSSTPRSDQQNPPGPDGGRDEPKEPEKKKGLRAHPRLLIAAGVALVVIAVGALLWWLHARNFESTDDAFIDNHIVRLAPQIAGRVTQVLVNDNQPVQPGQLVALIDSADVETRVAQARAERAQAQAQVDNALAQIKVSQAAYGQARADVSAAQAQADNAATELARYQRLLSLNPLAVAQQQLDQARATARQTGAQRDAALQAARNRAEQVTASRTQVEAGQDQVRAAQAQLEEANVNLGYTRIVSPIAGHVAQKTVAVGNYLTPGAQMMAIVPLQVWVTANFKETQLALMRPGQAAAIRVDACPASRIRGHIDSIQRGAGQAFGILPPENATGNYVKVVQRVPVKIVLDQPPPECPLGPGLSVTPSVRVR